MLKAKRWEGKKFLILKSFFAIMITNSTNQSADEPDQFRQLIELLETQLKGDRSLSTVISKLKEFNLLNSVAIRHIQLCLEVKQEIGKGLSKSMAIVTVSGRYGVGETQLWKAVKAYSFLFKTITNNNKS